MPRALGVPRAAREMRDDPAVPVNVGTEAIRVGERSGELLAPVPLSLMDSHRDHLWGRRDARAAAVAVKGGEPLACDWPQSARCFIPARRVSNQWVDSATPEKKFDPSPTPACSRLERIVPKLPS